MKMISVSNHRSSDHYGDELDTVEQEEDDVGSRSLLKAEVIKHDAYNDGDDDGDIHKHKVTMISDATSSTRSTRGFEATSSSQHWQLEMVVDETEQLEIIEQHITEQSTHQAQQEQPSQIILGK